MDGHPSLPSLAALVARRVLDAELAGLVVVLAGVRVPMVVAAAPGAGRDKVVDALAAATPREARIVDLAGPAEEFEWLPEATELGWRRERGVMPATGADAVPRASASTCVMLARDLAGDGPAATGGARARIVVRALSLGYGMVAGIDGARLEDVLDRLAAPDIGTDEAERSRLGIVLVLEATEAGPRITAAHYIRPIARDTHGHVQRHPPAVLATWSAAEDRWDHFAWGLVPDLAGRAGLRPVEFERAQARASAALRTLGPPG